MDKLSFVMTGAVTGAFLGSPAFRALANLPTSAADDPARVVGRIIGAALVGTLVGWIVWRVRAARTGR
jgi:flagellar motor component MotA